MRICHTSDLHGNYFPLPAADLYIASGDMLPNFPEVTFDIDDAGYERYPQLKGLPTKYRVNVDDIPKEFFNFPWDRDVNVEKEIFYQNRWVAKNYPELEFADRFLGNRRAPIICVRGNHDFVPLAKLFAGSNVSEIDLPEHVFEFGGLRFGGMRGIRAIVGEWSDELEDAEASDVMKRMPRDLDVLVTHAPPEGVLDLHSDHWGLKAIRNYIDRSMYQEDDSRCWPRLHCFGHIHCQGGQVEERGGIKFSNAATTVNVIDL